MNKTIIVLVCIIYNNAIAQQFEWVKTFNNSGPISTNFSTLNELCNIYSLNGNLIITGKSNGEKVDLDPSLAISEFIPSGNKNSDLYFVLLDSKGSLLASSGIFTPNGGGDNSTAFEYNAFQKMLKIGINTNSDSIKFNSGSWIRKSKNTIYLLSLDSILNFKNLLPIYSNKSCLISDLVCDNLGNTYITGTFSDSLIINNKLRVVSNISTNFLMKIDSNDSIVWLTHSNMNILGNGYEGKKILNYNIGENKINLVYALLKGKRGVIKNALDSFIYNPDLNSHQYYLTKIDVDNGNVVLSNTLKCNNNGIRLSEIRGNDSIIIVTGFGGDCSLQIDSETYTLNYNKLFSEIPFISCFNTKSFVNKYTNILDSCEKNISISDIHSDSLYFVFGGTIGNQLFDFKNKSIYSNDFLEKSRINAYTITDFFALYSSNNNLIEVWQLPPVNKISSDAMYISTKLTVYNNTLFVVGNINSEKYLGLGKRTYSYSSGSSSDVSVIKYNCKPTAFFNYNIEGRKVHFKNLSSNANSYLWEFGEANSSATSKNSSYTYTGLDMTFNPKLIIRNECGSDTFNQILHTTGINSNFLSKDFLFVYPIPASSSLKIKINNNIFLQNANIQVFDFHGQEIKLNFKQIEFDELECDISSLQNGFYTLYINSFDFSGNNYKESFIFIVLK